MMSDFHVEHLIQVIFENVQELKKKIRYDEFYNKIILRMYNYLESRQLKSGAIYDSNTKSVLNFQYHTAYYILCSLLMYYLTTRDRYLENAKISLRYLVKIGYKVNRRANSFIGIALGLSFLFCGDIEIRNEITRYLSRVKFYPEFDQKKKSANNFYALKSLSLLLRYRLLNNERDRKEAEKILKSYLIHWQYQDGFFYDTPFDTNVENGIPHLCYHATMMMVVFFTAILLGDKRLFASGKKALLALQAVTSPCGEAFSYGRSNNALFGFANAILACSLMACFDSKREAVIDRYRHQLLHFILRYQSEDGHLYIVPNSDEGKRYGFDKYMFVVSYEAYALSILMLSHFIKPLKIERRHAFQSVFSPHFVARKAGFVVYRSSRLSFGMNIKLRHFANVGYIDPRLIGGVPLWMTYDSVDILPGMPFSHGFITSKHSMVPFSNFFGEIINYFINWFLNIPYVVGFLPYIKSNNSIGIFLGAVDWNVSRFNKKDFKVEMQGPLWFLETKSLDIMKLSVRRAYSLFREDSIEKELRKVFTKSSYEMKRVIIVKNNTINFIDTIFGINPGNYRFVAFSVRTHADVRITTSQYQFIFNIPRSCLNMIVSRTRSEYLKLQKKVYSSKGAVLVWNISSESDGIYYEAGKIITRRMITIETAGRKG